MKKDINQNKVEQNTKKIEISGKKIVLLFIILLALVLVVSLSFYNIYHKEEQKITNQEFGIEDREISENIVDDDNNVIDENIVTESAENTLENTINSEIPVEQYTIRTKVDGEGGTISGEGLDIYETVNKGADSQKDIIAIPLTGYRVVRILVNGQEIDFEKEENNSVILSKFTNMQENKEIIVSFQKMETLIRVHHYEEGRTNKLSEDVEIQGLPGDTYKTEQAKDIPDNYEFVEVVGNAEGIMTNNIVDITYYYKIKTPTIKDQEINKSGTEQIENLTDEITYNILYKVKIEDYIGESEITLVDTLPYAIDTNIINVEEDLGGGIYDANSRTITWTETINNINTYTNPESGSIEINKTIKLVYTGIDQNTTNIENIVRGKISTKTPVKESDEVVSEFNTTTEFLVNIPVSKIWEDEDNKLNQRPNRVVVKLTGSDGREYIKELAKPGTLGSTTTQDSENSNRWNDIFEDLPKYDKDNQKIEYSLTELSGDFTYYTATVDNGNKIITNTNKYGKLTVHYYIQNPDGTKTTNRVKNANGEEIQDIVIEGKEGDQYKTTGAENISDKYELVEVVGQEEGNLQKYNEETPQEIIYYYRLKESEVVIHYLEKDSDTDSSNNQILSADENIKGHVDDNYNTNIDHKKETITKDGKTYTLVEDSGNTEGQMTTESVNVTYYYLQNTKATVRYVVRDANTHTIIRDLENSRTEEGLVGDDFVTAEKAFLGYELVEKPGNSKIKMTKEEQTLTYYYEPIDSGLVENHIDNITGNVLNTEVHNVQEGRDYNISKREFIGYDLVEDKLPSNSSGIMGDGMVTVNYYYEKKAVLEVNYVDILTNETISEQTVDRIKHEGDTYTTSAKTLSGYDLVETPENANGTLEVEVDANGNIANNKTVVTYYYSRKATVEEHHIDVSTGKELERVTIHNGHVGDEYDIPSKEFLGYEVASQDKDGNNLMPENRTGKMTAQKIVVNYYYNQPAKVIVHYVDKETGKEIEEPNSETGEPQNSTVIINGVNSDTYETQKKDFTYYTLVEKPTEEQGNMKVEITKDEAGNMKVNNTIELTYYYEQKSFNIGVEKEITGIVVDGVKKEVTNGKLERVESYTKNAKSKNVQIEYKISVINNGEIDGRVILEEDIPEGMTIASNIEDWEEVDSETEDGNGTVLRKIIPDIKVGETKEYTMLLNLEQSENNTGEKLGVVKIAKAENIPGFIENTQEDNSDTTNVVVGVETGNFPTVLLIVLIAMVVLEAVTLRYAGILAKKQKRKNNK